MIIQIIRLFLLGGGGGGGGGSGGEGAGQGYRTRRGMAGNSVTHCITLIAKNLLWLAELQIRNFGELGNTH